MFKLGPAPADPFDLIKDGVSVPGIHLYNGDKGKMVPWVSKNTALGSVLVPIKDIPNQTDAHTPDAYGYIHPAIPKMDPAILDQATAFFRLILTEAKTEAALLIALDEDDKYHLHCPEQEVDYTGVEWKDNIVLPEGQYLIGSIHSHCDFSAFHSGTDEGDAAKNDGLHITLGHLDDDQPEIDVMISFSGIRWQKWDPDDFLESKWKPADSDDEKQFELFDLNWIDQLSDAKPTYSWNKKTNSNHTSPATVAWDSYYGDMDEYDDWGLYDDWEGMASLKSSIKPKTIKASDYDEKSHIGFERRINSEANWYDDDLDVAQDQIIKDMSDLTLLAQEVGMTINFSVQYREGKHSDEAEADLTLLPELTNIGKETTNADA